MHSDADRQLADNRIHLLLQSLAEMQKVGAGLHADREADGRLSIHAIEHLRRVGVTAGDGDEIAEAKETVVHAQIDRAQTLLGNELAADTKNDSLRSGFHHAGRDNRVLRLKRTQDILLIKTERRDWSHRKFREDDFDLARRSGPPSRRWESAAPLSW